MAYTYNDPVIFAEYAIDVADACRAAGIANVAVSNGFIHAEPRREFYGQMDAVNVDLKAFTDDFYVKLTGSKLAPVLDSLAWLVHESKTWLEITTLLIPGHNDSDAEIEAESRWIRRELGPDVPLHFSAFHPDFRMMDVPPTPPATLRRARRIALRRKGCATSTPATSTTARATRRTARAAARRSSSATGTASTATASRRTGIAPTAARRSRGASSPSTIKRQFGPRRIPVAIGRVQ